MNAWSRLLGQQRSGEMYPDGTKSISTADLLALHLCETRSLPALPALPGSKAYLLDTVQTNVTSLLSMSPFMVHDSPISTVP